MEQLSLGYDHIKDSDIFSDLRPHIVDKFWKFHEANPNVWNLFVKFAIQIKNSGRKKYGIASITERIRWHVEIETKGDVFKISNDYRSCYARLLIITFPEMENFFELRGRSGILSIVDKPQ